MSSNSTSVCSLCRQADEKLFLKGVRCRTQKCAMEKRATSPGQHGKRFGSKRLSEYGKQLREKQKVKIIYGMRERQFRKFFNEASRQKGITGEILLSLLERRLDNILFRLKMAFSREQARQLIVHRHVNVNGKRVISPSFLVKVGDVITLADKTVGNKKILESVIDKHLNMGIKVPEWLELDKKERKGTILRLPIRSDVVAPIEEHLIVELYSK